MPGTVFPVFRISCRAMSAPPGRSEPVVAARGLTKVYGDLTAVDAIDFGGDVSGEFFASAPKKMTTMSSRGS